MRASIERHGWQPSKFSGYITGVFLIYKNDYLFVVRSGRHRSAILSYMGYASLSCAFTRMRARMIRIEDHPNYEMYKLFFDDALILKRRKFLDDLCSV